jgi:hypothetical protein
MTNAMNIRHICSNSSIIIYFCIFQAPKVEKVELVNGGYGIKNPLLTQTEFRHGPIGNSNLRS